MLTFQILAVIFLITALYGVLTGDKDTFYNGITLAFLCSVYSLVIEIHKILLEIRTILIDKKTDM